MRKFLLGALGIVAMAAPAVAADLPAKTYTKAPPPPPAPIYDWTGFYIGGNGGWGESSNCVNLDIADVFERDACLHKSGGLIGGQVGYRWQMGQFVVGLEAQGDWADISNSHVSFLVPAIITTSKIDGLGLFTGQLGYTWGPGLLYVKGGAAVTSNRFTIFDTITTAQFDINSTRWGGTIGVGFEYLFTPNWSFGVEYDHLFMGSRDNTFFGGNFGPVLGDRISQNVDMITARFNYKFGGPVVARY
jgi:outer membrane immunogenic protein